MGRKLKNRTWKRVRLDRFQDDTSSRRCQSIHVVLITGRFPAVEEYFGVRIPKSQRRPLSKSSRDLLRVGTDFLR